MGINKKESPLKMFGSFNIASALGARQRGFTSSSQNVMGNLPQNSVGAFSQNTISNGLGGSVINNLPQATMGATTTQSNSFIGGNSVTEGLMSIIPTFQNQTTTNTPRPNLNNNIMQKPQTPISPKALSNQSTINDVYGQMVPGTYNRSVGSPLQQVVDPAVAIDPLTGQQIDPTMDQSISMPLPPPTGVQTGITPNYGINTL